MPDKIRLEISGWSVVRVILILVCFYLLYFIRDIIALLFVVLVLVASFRPVIAKWEKKTGRLSAVILLALLLLTSLSLIVYLIIPPVVSQISGLVTALPDFMTKISFLSSHKDTIENGLKNSMSSITNSFVSITASVFGGVFTVFTSIVLTIYMLLDKKTSKGIINLIPETHRKATLQVIEKISDQIGNWFRGQLILSSTIAIIDLVGLLIIGVPYALALALLSGLFEFIPTLGPILSGSVAALIALSSSPLKALLVVILYLLVQQLENTIIVPKVMQKAVGLSPVIIILAIITGAKLLGLTGAILAVPIAASIIVILQEWPSISGMFKTNE